LLSPKSTRSRPIPAEERIESAFKLGAMHAAIDSAKQKLLAELAAAEAKIRAEFGA